MLAGLGDAGKGMSTPRIKGTFHNNLFISYLVSLWKTLATNNTVTVLQWFVPLLARNNFLQNVEFLLLFYLKPQKLQLKVSSIFINDFRLKSLKSRLTSNLHWTLLRFSRYSVWQFMLTLTSAIYLNLLLCNFTTHSRKTEHGFRKQTCWFRSCNFIMQTIIMD